MNRLKIPVNPAISKKIQEELFELGFSWVSGDILKRISHEREVKYLNASYLHLYPDSKRIKYNNSRNVCEDTILITSKTFFKEVLPKLKNTENKENNMINSYEITVPHKDRVDLLRIAYEMPKDRLVAIVEYSKNLKYLICNPNIVHKGHLIVPDKFNFISPVMVLEDNKDISLAINILKTIRDTPWKSKFKSTKKKATVKVTYAGT